MKTPKLKPKQQVLITAIVLAALIAVFIIFFIVPKIIQVGSTSVEEQSALTQLNTAKSSYSQLEELKKTSRKTEYELMTLERQTPGDAELPSLLMQLQDISAKSGINVISIKPTAPVQKNDYQEVPLEIEINGYFFSLLDFVYRVEKLPRIINITAIDVQEGEAKLPNIKVVVQATTFIMTPGLKETKTGTSGAATKSGGTTGTTQQQTTGATQQTTGATSAQ